MDLEASESAEERKASDPASSETKSSSENVSKSLPRLQALPPELKKVSAGSISLTPAEPPPVNTQTIPTVSPSNSSEEMVSESRRILASLATFQEIEKTEDLKSVNEKISKKSERDEKSFIVQEEPSLKRSLGDLEQARHALVRWLGGGSEVDIPLVELPKFLLKYSEIQGVAVIDQEGLILALESKLKVNYKVLANLTLRLFSQSRFAAEELEAEFQDQIVIGFKQVVLQISYHRGFYLIALFEQLPSSKILRRLRKVVKALARVEAGG